MRFLFIALTVGSIFAQSGYQKPPRAILDVLNAPGTPTPSVNPTHTHVLFMQTVRNPSITDLAKPMLRLAGLRIDPANSGPHLTAYGHSPFLQKIDGGQVIKLDLPAGVALTGLNWSPDGRFFSMMNHTPTTIDLWVGETATGRVKKIEKATLNASLGDAIDWMPDSRTLLVRLVPATREKMPEPPTTPTSPAIQESIGKAGATPTFQDLLKNPYDERAFEYFAQTQLAFVNAVNGQVIPIGKPALVINQQPSPDGQHILVTQIHKPFSYVLTFQNFPKEVEVWNRSGLIEFKVASLPMQERIPLAGVATGPRNVSWNPSETASLYWVEALDGGNPKEKVPNRDHVLTIKAPFKGEPVEVTKSKERLMGQLLWSSKGNVVIMNDMERERQWLRTMMIDPKNPSAPAKILNERNMRDQYRNPGTFMTATLPTGQNVLAESGGYLFLNNIVGSSAKGDLPFLDRLDPVTGKKERLFQCDADHFETVVALLSDDGSRFLTRRESPTQAPNFFIRDAKGSLDTFTNFADPAPQLRGITKQLVQYKRPDGVDLSFTLYLPAGHKQGTRLPTVVWAYPLEFTDTDTAGQVSGSTKRFTTINGYSHLFFLLEGYAILDGATIPIVGSPDEANNTYVEQLSSSAKAAIDKAVEMGVTDRDRVGVGGHSYGAFMTANLLAHTDLFRAGIARSGAYNRTLTPFGFQSERRTFWEAPETYLKMSPFMIANKIKAPILLIHGEADNNTGTFPIQSERMYLAIRGNGGTVRYVTLPHESHGYAAKETTEHVLWEQINWFDKYVKHAAPRVLGSND